MEIRNPAAPLRTSEQNLHIGLLFLCGRERGLTESEGVSPLTVSKYARAQAEAKFTASERERLGDETEMKIAKACGSLKDL